jgi:hypothetical protein
MCEESKLRLGLKAATVLEENGTVRAYWKFLVVCKVDLSSYPSLTVCMASCRDDFHNDVQTTFSSLWSRVKMWNCFRTSGGKGFLWN